MPRIVDRKVPSRPQVNLSKLRYGRNMATRIVFAAGSGDESLWVVVEEDPNAVFGAWTGSAGLPFALTLTGGGGKVWINPPNVAYWHEYAGH
jgi:hypothetical protein